jgi:YHS domain-containing protein
MTAARQERKSRPLWAGTQAFLWGAALLLAAAAWDLPKVAAAADPTVFNRNTGLAIDGFDPVSYFVDGKPRLGRPIFEVRYGGASWRFANEGNMAAFTADPEVYAPRFGGHDPVAIERGAATPGHPALWIIAEHRLYLFYSEEAREAFANDPESAIDSAERHWPEVRRNISR